MIDEGDVQICPVQSERQFLAARQSDTAMIIKSSQYWDPINVLHQNINTH